MALMEKAAEQGHVYAMDALADLHGMWKEHEQAVEWYTKGAAAGLPKAMFGLGIALDMGQGVVAPDYPAAAGWYRQGPGGFECPARCLPHFLLSFIDYIVIL
jgi:TPR repeat protein